MNCTNCNTEITHQGKFCLNCGHATDFSNNNTQNTLEENQAKTSSETDATVDNNLESYLTNSIFDSPYFNNSNNRDINDIGFRNYQFIIKNINNSFNFSMLWLGFIGVIATRTMAYNGFSLDIGLFFQTAVEILFRSSIFILFYSLCTKSACQKANISKEYPLFFASEGKLSQSDILMQSLEIENGKENHTLNIIFAIIGVMVFCVNGHFPFLSRVFYAISSSFILSTLAQSVKAFKWWSIITFVPILSMLIGLS